MKRTAADEALLTLARMAMDASVRAADDLGDISPVQLRALTALRSADGTNLAGLAEDLGVTVSTASRLVDRLVSAGWVHRGPCPRNGREISLTLTGAGTTLLARFDDRRLLRLRKYLAQVQPERQAAVVEALWELAAHA